MNQQVSNNDVQQIVNYLKSNLCDFIFHQLGPDQNNIVNLQTQLIEQKLINFRDCQKQLLNTFIKKYIALTNCFTISRSRFKQILFLNGNGNQNNLGFDLLKFDPQLKQIISKIPNKYGQIDKEVYDKIDQYQQEKSKKNLMAFDDDDILYNNQQKYQKDATTQSYQEHDISNRLNRSSSFIDYRNSSGFQKDFKNYVKSQSKKKSSLFEEQITQKDKSHSNLQQSQRYTRSYSQINLQRKKQNSSISQQEENRKQFKHKFSLIGGEDKQKSPYLKKHGNSNEDIQNQTISRNSKQNFLQEKKTLPLNHSNSSQYHDENDVVNCLIGDSNYNLNTQKVLTESNSQNTKFFQQKKKTDKQQYENLSKQQVVLNNSKSQNELNDNKQLKLQEGNPNMQIQQKKTQINKNDDSQEDIIRSVQLSYNNYAKQKGDPKLQKISLQQSPEKERKSQQLSYKNMENLKQQKQNADQNQIAIINTSYKNQIVQPQSYRYLAQSKSKEKLVKNNTQSRNIDDELYTDSSPIYIVNQNYEKRENLQPYFNEIIMTHSRRQNSIGKNYEIQVKYRVKKEFVEQCQQQNLSIKEALQSRIDYIQKDGSLAVFEQPSEEPCIQSFKHTKKL
ncbi:hypothetical protein ABPG72_000830 [Tetrahymena utriculariae]